MSAFRRFSLRQTRVFLASAALMFGGLGLAAQQPAVQAQRAAMQKLAFLAGKWSGPVIIRRGPGEPLRLTQTENIQYKLGGLVLLVEGASAGADGKPQFQALATIAYDEATGAYRIRAYNDGHYVDAELSLLPDGFSWGFQSGPAHVVNTMHRTAQGQWQETTEVTVGDHPAQKSVEMMLEKQGLRDEGAEGRRGQ